MEGRLDRDALPALRKVCLHHLKEELTIHLDVSGIYYLGKDGRDFLLSLKGKIKLIGMNQYLKQLLG